MSTRRTVIVTVTLGLGALVVLLAGGSTALAAHIVGEWTPGFEASKLGGPLVVDGYGVSGLGTYAVRLDDGTTALAVCIQADVGHSLQAAYVVEPPPSFGAELDYLLWQYLSPGAAPPTDEQAAAINVLAWAETAAQRRTGGPVVLGDDVEVRVLGVGRLDGVEAAIEALRAEATAQQGPWSFSELGVAAGEASVVLTGPGGPIVGRPVTFSTDTGATATASTAADGRAVAPLEGATGTVVAHVRMPALAATLAAPGSQRLAIAGASADLAATLVLPPPPTSTTTAPPPTTTTPSTTTPSTTTTTTTSTVPPTTPPSTTSPTSTGAPPPTTAPPAAPPPVRSTGPPPAIPATGAPVRSLARLGAWSFALGAVSTLIATPRVRRSRRAA